MGGLFPQRRDLTGILGHIFLGKNNGGKPETLHRRGIQIINNDVLIHHRAIRLLRSRTNERRNK